MNILLTNDDSYDSPLFHILYDILRDCGHEIDCVMPATEQSWKGKSMTRLGNLHASEADIDGRKFTIFEGTPADCVNFGLHHLCQKRPELVISGINMGYNVSLSYILSSGTVGAAIESYLDGIPSLSISQQLNAELFKYWHDTRAFPEEASTRLKEQFKTIYDFFENDLLRLSKSEELWSLELPCFLKDDWSITSSKPSRAHYGSTFIKNTDGTYSHCSPRLSPDNNPNSDINIMESGNIALNKLDFKSLC
jgi:5'-nucleotidase